MDNEVAAGIHKRLEAFSLPRNLRKQFPKERHKIRRVFRDTEELPLAENLSDPIDEALRNSDWLIVICSPRLKESRWCAKEVELFTKYHGQDHILCVLAEGEPAESFPEALLFRETTVVYKKGKEQTVKEAIEPLAADVRAVTKRGRAKKMDDAILRMAAPMYGLNYDDLKQRHKEQRTRRIAAISALAAAAFLIYAITSTVLAFQISRQKHTIEEQHEELQEQYYQQQIKYAQSMSMVSGDLLRQGLGQAAAYAVRPIMPSTKEDTSFPYVSSCQYALSNALALYEADEFIPVGTMEMPDYSFWQDAGAYKFLEDYLGGMQVICATKFNSDYVLVVSSNAHLYLYEEQTRILNDYTLSFFAEAPSNYVSAAAYKDGTLYILYSQAAEVSCYQWKNYDQYDSAGTGTLDERIDNRGLSAVVGDIVKSDDGEYVAVMGSDHSLRIYDASDRRMNNCLKAIYDLPGQICSMRPLEGTDYYLLIYSGLFSYLLDENLDIIARVSRFYDYSEDEQAFILYHDFFDNRDYDLYYMPLQSYEDIIEQADEFIEDYEPGEEMLERYQMLSEE